jgi:hypothetical protein
MTALIIIMAKKCQLPVTNFPQQIIRNYLEGGHPIS